MSGPDLSDKEIRAINDKFCMVCPCCGHQLMLACGMRVRLRHYFIDMLNAFMAAKEFSLMEREASEEKERNDRDKVDADYSRRLLEL